MSSIPLVALSVRPPEFQDPVANQGRLMQLRALGQQTEQQAALAPGQLQQQQQQLQLGKQAIQQGEFAVQDREAGMKAMQQWSGKDINELPDLIQKNGGSMQAVLGARKSAIEAQQSVMNLNTAQLNQNKVKSDYLLGKLQAATDKSIPDEQLPQSIMSATQEAIKDGYLDPQHAQEVQQLVQQYPDPADLRTHLGIYEKGLMSQSEQFAQEQKNRETKAAEESAQARAVAAQTSAARLQAEMPGGALASPDKAEMQDWLAKNPGKGPSDFLAYKASLAPKAQIGAQGGDQGGLSEEALNQAADRYGATGILPSMGMGAAGAAIRKAVMNRAAERGAGQNLAANAAEYKANQSSLTGLQKNFDMVTAFENTAGKNLDQFLSTAKKVVDSGSPWVNQPIRSIDQKALGSSDLAAFNAARVTALTEIAKVLNSSNASGVLSDSARSEVNELIGPNATLKQIVSAANILKTDMENRRQSYQQQIGDIQKRLGGAQGGGQTQSGAPSTLPQGAGKVIDKATAQQFYREAGNDPDKARQLAVQNGWKLQ